MRGRNRSWDLLTHFGVRGKGHASGDAEGCRRGCSPWSRNRHIVNAQVAEVLGGPAGTATGPRRGVRSGAVASGAAPGPRPEVPQPRSAVA